jgi:pyridoxine 4-dehydrogenase
VLRAAVERGITHIDTADFYRPFTVNELIREALHPYPAHLRIVTKVGARRGDDGSFLLSRHPDELTAEVHDNLRRLGVDTLDVVNLRLGTPDGRTSTESLGDRFGALAALREQGLIRHLGLSVVSDAQLTEAQSIAPVVTVQNLYNLATRQDDALVERCATENIAFAAFFPLGVFSPLQSQTLTDIAAASLALPAGPLAELGTIGR